MKESIVTRITENWDEIDRMEKTLSAPVPRLIMLEVTNACNLQCRMCGNRKMKRVRGRMPVELGRKAIREAAHAGIREVALYTTGEPLLYPELEKLIASAKQNNMRCILTSNGLLLNQKSAEMLCSSGLDSFKFSIDGTTREEYEDIRRGGSFDTLLKKVSLLKETRDRMGSGLKIICAMVLMKRNAGSIPVFRKTFGQLCDEILISPETSLGGKNGSAASTGGNDDFRPCRLLWDRIIVNYDGKITACCVDFDADMVYADLHSDSLLEAWNNKTMRLWRKMHLTNTIDGLPLCGNCDAPYVFEKGALINEN
ncbi:MAG: radical SAM/SPASM domain-containing protein [Nitrospirota bacterium]